MLARLRLSPVHIRRLSYLPNRHIFPHLDARLPLSPVLIRRPPSQTDPKYILNQLWKIKGDERWKLWSEVKKSFSGTSSRKGNFSFLGHTSKQDVEVIEPAYLNLSHSVDENLLRTSVEVSDRKLTVDRVLHELFQHGDSAQKYMQGSKTMKIENTILLDNYVQKSGKSTGGLMRALKNGSKRSKKHMSVKQHKQSGSFDLPKEFHNFELFKPMHEKWKSYILQLLKIIGKDQLPQCFVNADLHGAVILVVQCKVAACVGIHGIMVRETKETFGIITQDNKFRETWSHDYYIVGSLGPFQKSIQMYEPWAPVVDLELTEQPKDFIIYAERPSSRQQAAGGAGSINWQAPYNEELTARLSFIIFDFLGTHCGGKTSTWVVGQVGL
ncbi:hypothetical protein Salat_2329600 [Sesamum alatum]|uniref:Uncharacterized protein n=1 Tax=Sesamum alatum TaxID=300844 RepID=A0AAE1XW42_9LAMI|nr:hypothetical protein Salat_2329600 [Sesamum alatum]